MAALAAAAALPLAFPTLPAVSLPQKRALHSRTSKLDLMMLTLHPQPTERNGQNGFVSNAGSTYFSQQLEPNTATSMIAKSNITRRLAFENRDMDNRVLGQSGYRSEQQIRHSDVSYRMHSTCDDSKTRIREPVIEPPSCASAVLWDGSPTGKTVLLRHGSGCKYTIASSALNSLVSASSEHFSETKWGDAVLEWNQSSSEPTLTNHDSQFIIENLSSAVYNPFPSYCRIVCLQSSGQVRSNPSDLIPKQVYACALMDLASRMCSANAPLSALSANILIFHSPGPAVPPEISICSISSSFQVSLSPIKAMTVLDSGVLHSHLSCPQVHTPILGWLTIDRRRRLIPVLADDPTLDQFAVVGVFVSGIRSLQSPIISAACTWFNSCCNVNRSLIPSDGSFLLLHCNKTSHQAQITHSLYEAHPNFSTQPFSLRCSEFISFHGSPVILRPQLVVPEYPHPFLQALDEFHQESSAFSSDFFSGINEIKSLDASNCSAESKVLDRNMISPLPEPAHLPQPSTYPQIQAVSSSLDNPSVVFQKRPHSLASQSAEVSTSQVTDSLALVQTIIQQQHTISKLQYEKDQLLLRIHQLESSSLESTCPRKDSRILRLEEVAVQSESSANDALAAQDGSNKCSSPRDFVRDVSAGIAGSASHSGEISPSIVSGSAIVSNDSFTESLVATFPTFPSSPDNFSKASCGRIGDFESFKLSASGEYELKSESNTHGTHKCDEGNESSPPSVSSCKSLQSQKSNIGLFPSLHDTTSVNIPLRMGDSSECNGDSSSFIIPKITYEPLSDDDDSSTFARVPIHYTTKHSRDYSSSSNSYQFNLHACERKSDPSLGSYYIGRSDESSTEKHIQSAVAALRSNITNHHSKSMLQGVVVGPKLRSERDSWAD